MSAPGWYPDPRMVGTQRYWDGHNWTEHTAPMATTGHVRNTTGGIVAIIITVIVLVIMFGGIFVVVINDSGGY